MQTGENSVIAACIFIIVTQIHSAFIRSKMQVMTLWLNTTIHTEFFNSSLYTRPFNLTPFESLINFKDFLRSPNGESSRTYPDS